MATQRIIIAKVGGQAGTAVARLFRRWTDTRSLGDNDYRSSELWPETVCREIDRFAELLRENATDLSVSYFSEWIDHWLMGDEVPGPGAVCGKRFEASCSSPAEAEAWAAKCPEQFPEQEWLATRLREAAASGG